jgi:hypothetical protein
MLFRKLFASVLALVTTLVIALAALPQQVAQACLPCACPTNTSINCYGDYALYTQVQKNGTCDIEVLGINPKTGKPRAAIYVRASALAKLPEFPETNILIKNYFEFSLYKLTSGEYQLNVGPDFENKVHVIIWRGCPAENPYESSFISEEQ